MAENDWKSRLGVVYSTNPDFGFKAEEGGNDLNTLPAGKQRLIVSIDRKHRAGKQVTLVTGFVGKEEDLADLGKILKSKCGVGGSVKDGEIILQGDFRERAVNILLTLGYKVKRGN
ncbi:MAG: translation initiation factor [Bacteroidales bacterium]